MKYGLTDEQYKLLETLIIQPLKEQAAQVFIFGSRVTDNHHPHSDVDLLFRLPKNKSLATGLLATLKEAIEESRFPFAVDLVEEKDLVESYRSHVLKQMKPL